MQLITHMQNNFTAPQEVTQLMVDVLSDTSIQVQWGPPAQSNGILIHYTIIVFNQLTGYIFSSQVNPMDAEVVTVQSLSMQPNNKYLKVQVILT